MMCTVQYTRYGLCLLMVYFYTVMGRTFKGVGGVHLRVWDLFGEC